MYIIIIPNSGGDLRWFGRFLTAHGHTDVLSSRILVVICGGLRWCVVVCGGVWWFAVVCGDLRWFVFLVIPATPVEWQVENLTIS